MRASTRLTLFSLLFLSLATIDVVASVVRDQSAGLATWALLILCTVYSVGSSIASLIEKQDRGDR